MGLRSGQINSKTTAGIVLADVLVALIIASLGMVWLIRVHISSMAWMVRLEQIIQAEYLASDLVWQIQGPGLNGPRSGSVAIGSHTYRWQIHTGPLSISDMEVPGTLAKVRVSVGLDQDSRPLIVLTTALDGSHR